MSVLVPHRPWASTTTTVPLGLALYDLVTDARIAAGLQLEARSDHASRPRPAFATVSGAYGFRGLLPPEVESGPRPDPESPPADLGTAVVTVYDATGRFLPLTLRAPLGLRRLLDFDDLDGPASPSDGSPPEVGAPLYLFSSPARTLPAHVGAVRADVVTEDGRPAAWCRVEVVAPAPAGTRHLGIADAAGSVVIPVPYPPFAGGGTGDPLDPPSVPEVPGPNPLTQDWPVRVRVRHDPERLDQPLPDHAPTLSSILLDQREALVWSDVAGPPGQTVDPDPVLRLGHDLVLRTVGAPDARLLVTPAS
jgi:hypothetical protein